MSIVASTGEVVGNLDDAPDVYLLPMPCGCVADADDIVVEIVPSVKDEVLTCPWCLMTCSERDYNEWLSGLSPPVNMQRDPKPLIRFGNKVLEVVDRCSCGSPMVREHHREKPMHLSIPPELLELLRN